MIKILSVDFQKDFSDKKGKHFKPRANVEFIKNILLPYLIAHNIKIAEIISDYRLPRPADPDDSCRAGEWGYESEIPESVKIKPVWIKCMNSPIWIRENIGDSKKIAGLLYQDPIGFTAWANEVLGKPNPSNEIVLIGLTADCCVFCTAQELCWRGYNVKVLSEGVSTYSGDEREKDRILTCTPFTNWSKEIKWESLKTKIEKDSQ